MFVKFENPAVVQPQSFPHRIASLHSRIKGANPGLVAVHELTVDINDQVAISLIKFLKHLKLSFRAKGGISHPAGKAHRQSHDRATCWMIAQQTDGSKS